MSLFWKLLFMVSQYRSPSTLQYRIEEMHWICARPNGCRSIVIIRLHLPCPTPPFHSATCILPLDSSSTIQPPLHSSIIVAVVVSLHSDVEFCEHFFKYQSTLESFQYWFSHLRHPFLLTAFGQAIHQSAPRIELSPSVFQGTSRVFNLEATTPSILPPHSHRPKISRSVSMPLGAPEQQLLKNCVVSQCLQAGVLQ